MEKIVPPVVFIMFTILQTVYDSDRQLIELCLYSISVVNLLLLLVSVGTQTLLQFTSKMFSYRSNQAAERPLGVQQWGLFVSIQLIHV